MRSKRRGRAAARRRLMVCAAAVIAVFGLVAAVPPAAASPAGPARPASSSRPSPSAGSLGNLGAALRRAAQAADAPLAEGYRTVGTDGGVFDYGTNAYLGNRYTDGIKVLAAPMVGLAPTFDGGGYWLAGADGGVFAFGDAGFFGSAGGLRLAKPVVGVVATPDSRGYWMVASDGGVFAYGDAGFFGSAGGIRLAKPIVGMAATPDGGGYWLVASDGGVFAYGDATFLGSEGGRALTSPVVGMAGPAVGAGAPTAVAPGYHLVGADGGVFSFGSAGYFGSVPGAGGSVRDAVGITPTSDNGGYWIATADGMVDAFGDARFLGDHQSDVAAGLSGAALSGAWVGITSVPPPGDNGTTPPPAVPTVSLALGPGSTAGEQVGSPASLVVTASLSGQPDTDAPVTVTVTGANPQTLTATTDDTGHATVTYTGHASGVDTATATVASVSSATVTVTWSAPLVAAATSPVTGSFFAEPAGTTTFVAAPGDTPAFAQTFPDVAFDPPAGLLPIPAAAPTTSTVPFSDVITDSGGAYTGVQPATGNGYQAGAATSAGDLTTFDAVFDGSLTAAQGGYLTIDVIAGDGYVLGVGGGATAYSGTASAGLATTPFADYPVDAASDTCLSAPTDGGATVPGDHPVTIHLPAAGSYPYELDYFSCDTTTNDTPVRSLVLRSESLSSTPPTSPSVYLGYADTDRLPNDFYHDFPYPWADTPGVNFQGCTPAQSCTYDGGAIRVDNTTDAPETINKLVVTFAATTGSLAPYSCTYDIWAPDAPAKTPEAGKPAVVLQPGQTAIYTQEVGSESSGCQNTDGEFDTSDLPGSGYCTQTQIIPQVALTVDGATTTYADTAQILNTGGIDVGNCKPSPYNNESIPWTRVAGPGTGTDVPLPPEASLSLGPTQALTGGPLTDTVGNPQTFTATATTASGTDLADVPVTFVVTGANPERVTATTDAQGVATTSYTGLAAGTDTVAATASYQGLELASGLVGITWNIPVPGGASSGGSAAQAPPQVAITSPADGSTLSQASPVQATITPPAGETIATWTATLASGSGPATTLASGTGAPPATLATLDPATLVDGSYHLTVTATASGGGTNTATATAVVPRVAHVGEFSETYQDLTTTLEGFPVTIDRTYNSFDKSVGDFGVGWHLSSAQYSVATNGVLGSGGWSPYPSQCSLFGCDYAYQTTVPHTVSVTLPDGTAEVFDFTASGSFGPLYFLNGQGVLTARPGTNTTGTLAVYDDPGVYYGFDGNLYTGASDGTETYDPTDFVYTDSQGDQYLLSTIYGLLAERAPTGSCVGYSPTGITGVQGATSVSDGGGGTGLCTNGGNPVKLSFALDGQERITTITEPGGNTYSYAYGATGDLTSVTLPGTAGADAYTYDADHDLLTQSGPGAPVLTETYDASGHISSITDGDGHTTQISDDAAARTQTLTDALGKLTTVLSYDAAGDLIGDQDVAGGQTRTTTHAYDALGDVTSTTDADGHTSRATFDANGDQTSATDADGHTTSSTFGPMSEVLTRTDGLGATTHATYDATGDLLSLTDPVGHTTRLTYDASGDPVTVTDPAGNLYGLSYNKPGQLNEVATPTNHTDYSYDSDGQLTASDPAGFNGTSYTYDAAEREASAQEGSSKTTTTYDAAGNVASTTDGDGNTTAYGYDTAGQLTSITDADGGTVTFTYDADGNLLTVTDPDGHTTAYTYDGFGDRITATSPTTGTTTYAYDADGRVTSSTDAAGQTTTYTYDPDGNLTGRTTPQGATTWSYDADGHLVSMTDPTGTTTYTYDADGHVTQVASPEGTTAYTYDADGERATMTLPGGKVTTYSRNAVEQVTSESVQGQTFKFLYNLTGPLDTIQDPNGQITNYSYDQQGDTTAVDSAYPTGPNSSAPLPSTTYNSFDADGNPTSITGPTGTTAYSYDKLDRLVSAAGQGSAPSYAYTYDRAGNITSSTTGTTTTPYTYNGNGQLTAVGSQTVTSDADGDITGIGTQTFTYNAGGQLASTVDGPTTTSYTYDGLGNRVGVTTNGTADPQVIDQVDPTTGQLDTTPQPPTTGADPSASVPNPASSLASVQPTVFTGTQDGTGPGLPTLAADDGGTYASTGTQQIVGSLSPAGVSSYVPDALDSTIGTVNTAGQPSGTTSYTPYGGIASSTGTQAPFGFTGQAQDSSNLVFLRARSFEPLIGRFLAPDVLRPDAVGTTGYGSYIYGSDAPTVNVDPTGAQDEIETQTVASTGTIQAAKVAQYLRLSAPFTALGLKANLAGNRTLADFYYRTEDLLYEHFFGIEELLKAKS